MTISEIEALATNAALLACAEFSGTISGVDDADYRARVLCSIPFDGGTPEWRVYFARFVQIARLALLVKYYERKFSDGGQ